MTTESPPTSDEKLMAALSYWGNLILGFIPALVIFLLKKEESPYIKKHSLQCLIFNVATVALSIGLCIVLSVMSVIPIIGTLLSLLGFLVYVGIFLGYWVYSAVLGFQVFQGQDPEIPVLWDKIQEHLGTSSS